MLLPAATGEGAPALATTKSTAALTSVLTVVELLAALGSLVAEDTDEFAVMVVPSAVAAVTFTGTLMFSAEPALRLGFVHVTVPGAPPAGAMQGHPPGAITTRNDVFARGGSPEVTGAAGPLFGMVCV